MILTTQDLLKLRKLATAGQIDLDQLEWLQDQLDAANGLFATMDVLRDLPDRALRNLATLIEAEQKERA